MKLKLNDYSDGEILKILREWRNLTQAELAKKIGKDKRTVYDYEAGNFTYNIQILRKIAKELNLEITIETK